MTHMETKLQITKLLSSTWKVKVSTCTLSLTKSRTK